MKARIAAALVIIVLSGPAASADGDDGSAGATAGTGGLWGHVTNQNLTGNSSQNTPSDADQTSVTIDLGTELVEGFCDGLNWTPSCVPQEAPEEQAVVTTALVTQAFQFTPLPPQNLIVQPPNGRTLVNFETNFFTDAPEVLPIIAVPLLDQVVELRVWPESFTWHFGDGRSVTTSERGAPYPTMGVTHEYRRKGQVAPSLDTTYAAQWRLQGQGAWQPVDGTVTIAGAPAQLDVLTATPQLVG